MKCYQRNLFIRLDERVQVALFSATLTDEIKEIVNQLMKNPVNIFIPLNEQTLDGILQYYIKLEDNHKIEVNKNLYSTLTIGTTIILCNSIRTVYTVANRLISDNFSVSTIHGNRNQSERNMNQSEREE